MGNRTIDPVQRAVAYIETHLDGKLEWETVAAAVHYSKFYLHRLFTETVGMTPHDYIGRRQLTEAAKQLVFSPRPILDIAYTSGYESQQAFSMAFKAMYKLPPAAYRRQRLYYPLQGNLQESVSRRKAAPAEWVPSPIRLATRADISAWLELVRLVVDGYPCLDVADYRVQLTQAIDRQQALIWQPGSQPDSQADTPARNQETPPTMGVMAFSYGEYPHTGNIDFLGIHPQYRNRGIQKRFIDILREKYLPGCALSTTTYRERDKADTGYRRAWKRLGFAEDELLVEFGYPTQRLILPSEARTGIRTEARPEAATGARTEVYHE